MHDWLFYALVLHYCIYCDFYKLIIPWDI